MMTGAGWGGCAVSLVPADRVQQFVDKMRNECYAPCPEQSKLVGKSLFIAEPGDGAAMYMF